MEGGGGRCACVHLRSLVQLFGLWAVCKNMNILNPWSTRAYFYSADSGLLPQSKQNELQLKKESDILEDKPYLPYIVHCTGHSTNIS